MFLIHVILLRILLVPTVALFCGSLSQAQESAPDVEQFRSLFRTVLVMLWLGVVVIVSEKFRDWVDLPSARFSRWVEEHMNL